MPYSTRSGLARPRNTDIVRHNLRNGVCLYARLNRLLLACPFWALNSVSMLMGCPISQPVELSVTVA